MMNEIKKKFRLLSEKGRDSVRRFYMFDTTNSEDLKYCKEAMKNNWITIEDGKFTLTTKGVELRKENVSKTLNVNTLKNRVRDDLMTKEDALFSLDVQIERIEKMKNEINEINKKTKVCKHIMKPKEASFTLNQFGHNPVTFTWTYQCELCGKKKHIMTNNRSDCPHGFENITVSDRTLSI